LYAANFDDERLERPFMEEGRRIPDPIVGYPEQDVLKIEQCIDTCYYTD